MLLAGPHERQADTPATMSEANSQSIHVPAPTIPGGDQRAQDQESLNELLIEGRDTHKNHPVGED